MKKKGTRTELSSNYTLFQTFRNCSQTLHIGIRQGLRTLISAPQKKHYSWSLTDDAT